jgi:hypothetical protein
LYPSRAVVLPTDTAGCCVISEELALEDSSTGRISGEIEARLIVWIGVRGTTIDCVEMGRLSASLELKSSCENVIGVGAR